MNRLIRPLLAAVTITMVHSHCMELMHSNDLNKNLTDTVRTSFVHAYSIEGQDYIYLFPQGILLLRAGTTFSLFNVLTREKITLQSPEELINTENLLLNLSPDGKTLVMSITGTDIVVWDAQTGALRRNNDSIARNDVTHIRDIQFSPTGNMFLTTSHYHEKEGHGIKLWNAITGSCITSLYGHTSSVWQALFSAEGRTIVTYSDDNTVRSWNIYTGTSQELLEHTHGKIIRVEKSSNEDTLITALRYFPTIFVWNPKTKVVRFKFTEHTAPIIYIEISPDDTTVLSGDDQYNWFLWDKKTGGVLQRWQGFDLCFFSYTENRIAALINMQNSPLYEMKAISVFDSKTGKSLELLKDEHIQGCDFSKDKDTLITIGHEGTTTAKLWSIKRSQLVQELHHKRSVVAVRFIDDVDTLITETDDHILHVWKRLSTYTEEANLHNDSQVRNIGIEAVNLSKDSQKSSIGTNGVNLRNDSQECSIQ